MRIVLQWLGSPIGVVTVAFTLVAAAAWMVWPSAQEQDRLRRAEAVLFARQCLADGRSPSACYQACDETPNFKACRSVALAAMEELRGR